MRHLTALAREQLICGKLTREKIFFECCIAVQCEKQFFASRMHCSLGAESRDHFDESANQNLVTLRTTPQ